MILRRLLLLASAGLGMLLGPAVAQTEAPLPPAADRKIDFATDVEPILKSRCISCHAGAQQMSGLRLDSREAALKGGYSGPAIQPGNSAASKLIERVTGKPGVMAMPPAGPRLSDEQVGILRAWIDQGPVWKQDRPPAAAPAPRFNHWSFKAVALPDEPAVERREWARNAIDAFVLARLEREGIAPSPEASKRTQLRRLALDLTGLPPTPEEMRAFLADSREDAYERAVERLLASPHFGERWARPWLDRARYGDSDGYEKDWVRPHAWRYRHWVIEALNRDMPFDRFTVEQIAGDLLPGAGTGPKIAVGFHRNTLTNREGGVDSGQFRFEAAVDRTNTVSATWLGLTVGCAQCHDHKYDPISQKDYFQMYAFFENVEEVDIDAPLPAEIGPYLRSRDEYRSRRRSLLDEYKVAALQADWEREMMVAAANPGQRTDWDLAWDCLLKLTEGGDGEKIIRIAPEKRSEREVVVLTDHFVRNYHFAVGQKRYKELKLDELAKKLRELHDEYPQLSQAMSVEEGPRTGPSRLRVRGDYRTLGIEVQPDGLSALPPLTAAKGSTPTRLDLARWIVAPENPLTARVTVNWIWQELFGQGLVKSSDDFGTRGDPPSHPELLDWLAYRFRDDGWSMKRLIRQIVTSATYRQSSKIRPELASVDPDNTLLARQSRLRLPAEVIRDSALHAGGLLSLEVGGKSVRPPQPAGVSSLGYGKKDDDAWQVTKGDGQYRRGLYIHFQRSTPYPMLVNFDAPKGTVTQCRRERSNTPLQALNLLNDPVFLEAAAALAYQSLAAPDDTARLTGMFERALGRPPEASERQRFSEYHKRLLKIYEADGEAAGQLAPAAITGMKRSEAAAWVNLASALLNLDEFITRE